MLFSALEATSAARLSALTFLKHKSPISSTLIPSNENNPSTEITTTCSDESKQNEANNESLGIIGRLVPETFHRSADGLTAYFQITDESSNSNLKVSYQGEVGQIFFNQNAEIIMRGKMLEDGVFYTKDLSIKCPSKYMDEMYTEDYTTTNTSS